MPVEHFIKYICSLRALYEFEREGIAQFIILLSTKIFSGINRNLGILNFLWQIN